MSGINNQNQIDMFLIAHEHNLDMDEFFTKFMESWLKSQLDSGHPYYKNLPGRNLFDWMVRYNTFSEKESNREDVEWAAKIFTSLSEVVRIRSRWVPRHLTFNKLVENKYYFYDQDFEQSLFNVCKDCFHLVNFKRKGNYQIDTESCF